MASLGRRLLEGLASLVLPGLGQYAQGRRLSAALHLAAAVLLWAVQLGWIVHVLSAFGAVRWEPSGTKGRTKPARLSGERIPGPGHYRVEAVGESHYQPALEKAAGGRKRDGVYVKVDALLVPEDDNRYDKNAVRVKVGGATVGYLSRADAVRFRKRFLGPGKNPGGLVCKGEIRGGWDRGKRDKGHFGIALDFPRDF